MTSTGVKGSKMCSGCNTTARGSVMETVRVCINVDVHKRSVLSLLFFVILMETLEE